MSISTMYIIGALTTALMLFQVNMEDYPKQYSKARMILESAFVIGLMVSFWPILWTACLAKYIRKKMG